MEISFSQLPPEMVQHIMTHLDSKTLLRCRSVSHSWNSVSTSVLHSRHTSLLKNWYKLETGMKIFTLFDKETIPWSAYSISQDLNVALREEFISFFGHQIKDLRIEDNFWKFNLSNMFDRMPNLEKIALPKFRLQEPAPTDDIATLNFLKHIEIAFCANNFQNEQNMDFILKYATKRLRSLKIVNFNICNSNLTSLLTLLSKIPVLHISIGYVQEKSLPAFEHVKLKIQKLAIGSTMASICSDHYFGKSLDQLKELKIELWPAEAYQSPMLIQLPSMPTVTKLTINLGSWNRTFRGNQDISLVIRFPREVFPNCSNPLVFSRRGHKIPMTEFSPLGSKFGMVQFFGSRRVMSLKSWKSAPLLVFQKIGQ